MWRTILQDNIRHFRELLAAGRPEHNPETLQRLLIEAESEFEQLERASTHERARSDAVLRVFAETAIDDAMRLTQAQFGSLQIFDETSASLIILAQRNFRNPFLEHFAVVKLSDGSACARAGAGSERIMIENIATDPAFEPHRRVAEEAGFQAVQSTPLRDSAGKLIGVLSTHFSNTRCFSAGEHAMIDRHCAFVAATLARLL